MPEITSFQLLEEKRRLKSVAEKIETGRYASLDELDDLVAFTLIVPTLRQEREAVEFCESSFDIFNRKGRDSFRKSPELFKFDATRLYGRFEGALAVK